jgi:hypothetical protein
MEKELKNAMENVFTDLAYKIFKVITAKEDNNKLLDKAENTIERFKDKMSEEEYQKFKYFVLGHKMIDMHIKRPETIILTNVTYDVLFKDKEEKEKKEEMKEEEISLDCMSGDIKKQLNDLMDAFKRL